jgi:hypothetical protein
MCRRIGAVRGVRAGICRRFGRAWERPGGTTDPTDHGSHRIPGASGADESGSAATCNDRQGARERSNDQ